MIAYSTSHGWFLHLFPSMPDACAMAVEDAMAAYRGKGYKVVDHRGAESRQVFVSDWTTDGIAAFAIAGEGGEVEFRGQVHYVGYYTLSSFTDASLVRPDQVHPPYRLQAVGAYFCGSAVPATDPNTNRPTFSWQHLASQWGTFVGFNGSPCLYDFDIFQVAIRPNDIPD